MRRETFVEQLLVNYAWLVFTVKPSVDISDGCLHFTSFFINGRLSEKSTFKDDRLWQNWFPPWRKKVGVSKTCELWPINTVQICLSPDCTLWTVRCRNVEKFCIALSMRTDVTGLYFLHSVMAPLTRWILSLFTLDAWINILGWDNVLDKLKQSRSNQCW